MKPLCATLLAALLIPSALYLAAVPPDSISDPSTPLAMPVPPPPPPPKDPVQPPFPPTPPVPGPSAPATPVKPAEKRCPMDKPHRAHEWKDAQGRVYYCNGGVDPLPPGGSPTEPPKF